MDIDKQFRVLDGDSDDEAIVDMGADEYCWSLADFNEDERVDYLDFVTFADAWLTSSGEGDYNPDCDLNEDDYIDYGDFAVFANDWLWQACWKDLGRGFATMMTMGGGGEITAVPMVVDAMVIESAVPEPTIEERIAQAEDAIKFLERIWKEDKELREQYTQKYWDDFIGSIEDWIDELEAGL